MAITLLATIKTQAGKEAEAEQAFRAMIEKVRSSEPGTLAYVLHRSAQDPTTFVFYESYQDEAALDAHRNSAHMKELGGKLASVLAGRPEIQMLTELARK